MQKKLPKSCKKRDKMKWKLYRGYLSVNNNLHNVIFSLYRDFEESLDNVKGSEIGCCDNLKVKSLAL